MVPLRQAKCVSSQKFGVLHDWIHLHVCFERYRECRPPFTLEAGIRNEEQRLGGCPASRGSRHLVPESESRFGGMIEYVDVDLFC